MTELGADDAAEVDPPGKQSPGLFTKIFRGVVTLVAVSVAMAVLLALEFLWSLGHRRWPPIENADLLVQDCQRLPAEWCWFPEGERKWPASVRALHPRAVDSLRPGTVKIWVSSGGGMTNGHDGWGYVVVGRPARASESAEDDRLTATNHPNLFKFEQR